jgi:signal transduction histidine kinase/CheY-like chemotaxis protein
MMASVVTTGLRFTPELAKGCLVLALISTAVVVGLFAYVGQRTGRKAFGVWALGWLFFAVFLSAQIAGQFISEDWQLASIPSACVALSAWFIFCGNREWLDQPVGRRDIAIVSGLIAGLSYLSHSQRAEFWFAPLAFGALAGATEQTAWLHYGDRRSGASRWLVTGGLAGWGLLVGAVPLVANSAAWFAMIQALSAACTLALVIGVIIEHEISSSEQKYRSVLDAMSDAVFIVDLWTLKIIDANQSAARLARRDPTELVGSDFVDLCPGLRREGANMLDKRNMFAAVFKPFNEIHFARADGSMVLCEGDTSLAQWHHRPVIQVRVHEVVAEKNIGQLVRRAEKMSSLGQLIAGVAHELNNPLAVVVGYAQILTKHPIADEIVSNNIQRILHETERAAKIVRDLLLFARPCEPQLTVVDLNKLISNVFDVRQRDLEQYQVELHQHLQPGLCHTKADPIQLEQVLNNLITNALHAMANRTTGRALTVATAENSHFIRISISDTGCGIAPDVMGRMFDPFFTTKPVGKGTGLGLSISRSILEEHHGRLWAESEVGHGASFHLEIPIVACEPPVAQPAEPVADEIGPAASQGHRLLVVDDEPGIREVLEAILVGRGYDVTAVTNGLEALDCIKRGQFDLIISDMCMPEMDGERLYETVREKNPRLADRILFVTGDVVSARSRTFLDRVGNRWLSKPFNIRDVEELVASSLGEAASSRNAAQTAMLN